jgi:RNA recognition motif-containing protein
MEVPSQTLYINNINEKIKSDVLKKMLYMIFSQYGKVVDVIAKKGVKLRGQAWVVFQDKSAATNALRGKQGFNFYEKPLVSLSCHDRRNRLFRCEICLCVTFELIAYPLLMILIDRYCA